MRLQGSQIACCFGTKADTKRKIVLLNLIGAVTIEQLSNCPIFICVILQHKIRIEKRVFEMERYLNNY